MRVGIYRFYWVLASTAGLGFALTNLLMQKTVGAADNPTVALPTALTNTRPEQNPNVNIKGGVVAGFSRCGPPLNPATGATNTGGGIAGGLTAGLKTLSGNATKKGAPAGAGAAAGGAGASACTLTDAVADEAMSCEAVLKSGSSLKAAIKAVDSLSQPNVTLQEGINQCDAQIKEIPNQIACFKQEWNAMQNQINQIQQQYQANYNQVQTQLATMKSQLDDRKNQADYIKGKLAGGDPNNPTKISLKDAKDQMEKRLADLPAAIGKITDGQQRLANMKQVLLEQKATRKMALTRDCLTGSGKPIKTGETCFKCNDQCVTIPEYIVCAAQGNGGGNKSTYKIIGNRANQEADDLRSLFSNMIADFPTDGSIPNSTDEVANRNKVVERTDSGSGLQTIAQIEEKWGSKFDRFNQGVNMRGFIFRQMALCNKEAIKKVSVEEGQKTSSVGQIQENIKQAERSLTNDSNALMRDYQSTYGKGMKALTDRDVQPGLGQCIDAKPEVVSSCLDDMRNKYEALLKGGPMALAPVPVDVPANSDAMKIKGVTCNSISNCLDTYEALNTWAINDVKFRDSERGNFITKANQQIEAATRNFAAGMKLATQGLQARLDDVYGKLGISPDTKTVEPEAMENQTEDPNKGLIKMPKNLLKFLAGYMSPAPPDIGALNGGAVETALKDQRKEVADKKTELRKSKDKLAGLAVKCVKDAAGKIVSKLKEDLNTNGKEIACSAKCEPGDSTSLGELMKTVNLMSGGSLSFIDDLQSLGSGARVICNSSVKDLSKKEPEPVNSQCEAYKERVTCVQVANATQQQTDELNLCNTCIGKWATYKTEFKEFKDARDSAFELCRRISSQVSVDKGALSKFAGGEGAGSALGQPSGVPNE